jgi:glycosyltransferase involved in cell wall biosynthesis
MRHAAISFAEQIDRRLAEGESWDVLFCSDMLNLAEFKGLVDGRVQKLPSVAYFHENQLTYPDRYPKEWDLHFAMTNFTTCLTATQVWFNSDYHRRVFLEALPNFLRRMPDHRPLDAAETIIQKMSVHSPGVELLPPCPKRTEGPLEILWAARWEHDKGPDLFFEAIRMLKQRHIPFRLNVVGEQFEESPEVFTHAINEFPNEIVRWGWQKSREEYIAALHESDVIVSTADHEFFGISVVEAVAAGASPLLPERLSYPEILRLGDYETMHEFFYDGTAQHLADKLAALAVLISKDPSWRQRSHKPKDCVERFLWNNLVGGMDDALDALLNRK